MIERYTLNIILYFCTQQPPLETLIQIAQCLDVDVQDLIRVPEHNPFKD